MISKFFLSITSFVSFLIAFLLSTRGVFPYFIDAFILALVVFYYVIYCDRLIKLRVSLSIVGLWFLFFSFILISSFYNEVQPYKYLYYYVFFVVFILCLNMVSVCQVKFVKCFSAVNFIICFFSILSFINVLNIPELIYSRSGSERIYGLIGNPNYFAYMIFINIILINIYKEYFSKYKFIIYQLILTFAVIFSLSRGVLIGLFFFYLLINVRALTIKKISLFICVVCVLFSVVNFSVDSDMIINTINYRIDNLINGDGSGRFDIWAIGFESISSHLDKIITGVGPNMFGTYAHSLGLNNTTHNSFLRLFFELGIFGFGLFFVMMGYFFKKIECISLNMKIAIAVGVSFSWLSNDFILNKETWVLLAMLVSYDTLKREEYN